VLAEWLDIPQVEEKEALQREVETMAASAAELPELRDKHAALLKEAAAVTLLKRDVELLGMQVIASGTV
jgi:hypothetical protein